MRDYLYDDDSLNDARYLLNKDTLYYSLYALMSQRWNAGETLDTGFMWDDTVWWNHMEALDEYERPEVAAVSMPAGRAAGGHRRKSGGGDELGNPVPRCGI